MIKSKLYFIFPMKIKKKLKTKSIIRPVYSSLVIEDNSFSKGSVQNINDDKLVFDRKDNKRTLVKSKVFLK